jgi:hypothetical protein
MSKKASDGRGAVDEFFYDGISMAKPEGRVFNGKADVIPPFRIRYVTLVASYPNAVLALFKVCGNL